MLEAGTRSRRPESSSTVVGTSSEPGAFKPSLIHFRPPSDQCPTGKAVETTVPATVSTAIGATLAFKLAEHRFQPQSLSFKRGGELSLVNCPNFRRRLDEITQHA